MKLLGRLVIIVMTLMVPWHVAAYEAADSLPPSAKRTYTLIIQDNPVGLVSGYSYDGGLLISLPQFFKTLRFTVLEEEQGSILKAWYQSRTNQFTIHNPSHRLTRGTTTQTYDTDDVIQLSDGLYADTGFLRRYFSFNLAVDHIGLTLKLTHHKALPGTAPDTKPKPAPQVSKENIEYRTTDIEIQAPPQTKPKEELTQPTTDFSQKIMPDFDNYLIFELAIGNLVYDDVIDIYQQDETEYYVALRQLMEALQLAVEIDDETGTASGWFIKESNTFSLDANQLQAMVKGKASSIEPGKIFADEGDIFVHTSLLEAWFPLLVTAKFGSQLLDVHPTMLLPMQEKKEREILRERWLERGADKKDYPVISPPYAMFSMPVADISLNSQFFQNNDADNDLTGGYSAIVSGDLAYMNTNWFLSGTDDEVGQLRFIASHRDLGSNVWGTGLTELKLGDVNSVEIPFVSGSSQGRGVTASTYPLSRASEFDATTLEGDALPGWEVELYNNNTLLDFQVVGNNGKYRFENVPILYGNNAIRLVFYGPQGERREEVQNYSIADAIIPKGEYHYRMSANEEDAFTFPVNSQQQEGNIKLAGEMEYGITDNLTAFYGSSFAELDDGNERNYQSLGFATMLLDDIITQVDTAYNVMDDGYAARFTGHTRKWNTNFRLSHAMFSNYISEFNLTTTDKTETVSNIDINGVVALPVTSIQYGLSGEYEIFESDRSLTTLGNSLTTSIQRLSFTNNLAARYNKNASGSVTETMDGDIAVRGRYKTVSVRLNSNYDLHPDTEFLNAGLTLQKDINKQVSTRVGMDKQLTGDKTATLSGTLNWINDYYRMSMNVSGDDNSNYSAGINLAFSLYQPPQSNDWNIISTDISSSGMVAARAYLDSNANQQWDEDEELLSETKFLKNNKKISSNDVGIAMIYGLDHAQPTNIEVDKLSLEDAYWQPAIPGYAALGRAGRMMAIDFPIVETSEIEGTVYYGEEPIAGITLYLLTKDGQRQNEVVSEFDGLFIFENVMQGDYVIVPSEEQLTTLGYKAESNLDISVGVGSEVYMGKDITLLVLEEETVEEKTETISDSTIETPEEIKATNAHMKRPQGFVPQPVKKPRFIPTIFRLQLNTYQNEDKLHDEWEAIQWYYGSTLDNLHHTAETIIVDGTTHYLLRAGPFHKEADAAAICTKLENDNQPCIVIGE